MSSDRVTISVSPSPSPSPSPTRRTAKSRGARPIARISGRLLRVPPSVPTTAPIPRALVARKWEPPPARFPSTGTRRDSSFRGEWESAHSPCAPAVRTPLPAPLVRHAGESIAAEPPLVRFPPFFPLGPRHPTSGATRSFSGRAFPPAPGSPTRAEGARPAPEPHRALGPDQSASSSRAAPRGTIPCPAPRPPPGRPGRRPASTRRGGRTTRFDTLVPVGSPTPTGEGGSAPGRLGAIGG